MHRNHRLLLLTFMTLGLLAHSTTTREAADRQPSDPSVAGPDDSTEKAVVAMLDRLEANIAHRECLAPEVSKVDVAWHIAHSLKVVNQIHKELEASDPESYRWTFNPFRSLALARGKLPRGKAKSPARVMPPETNPLEDLERQLETARGLWPRFDELPEKSFFVHPVFGRLKRDHAKRFIEIHTAHHLAIIDDIVPSCGASS